MSLTELANRFKSDKGTQAGTPPHRYTYLYDLLFWPLKEEALRFLEIGLAVGGPEVGGSTERTVASPSAQMWLSYFPKAHIYGFDISDFSHIEDPRFTFIRGDAGSEADLRRLGHAAPTFDVIIDDASHASYHQQLAFKILFPKLAPGGVYIIEDLQWQSPVYENALPQVPKTAVFFQSFFDKGVYVESRLLTEGCIGGIKAQIASFAAFAAFDGSTKATKLIVMRKACDNGAGETAIPQPARSALGPAKASTGDSTTALSVDEFIAAAYAGGPSTKC
jgi:hypothetical protein